MAQQTDIYTIAMITSNGTWLVQRARLTFKQSQIVFNVLKAAYKEDLIPMFYVETEEKPMDFDDTFASFRPLTLTRFWPEEDRPKQYR